MVDLPTITVVTPSYNQARFLRKTIESVLGGVVTQGRPLRTIGRSIDAARMIDGVFPALPQPAVFVRAKSWRRSGYSTLRWFHDMPRLVSRMLPGRTGYDVASRTLQRPSKENASS